ncbi:MAG: transcriptional repressor [Bacillota bacterium]|nr:transcriptional repressor [Bacillota bacterium]
MSRNTIQQEIICSTVKSMTSHPSSDDVYKAIHDKYPTIGKATVYRVLNNLAKRGEIRKIIIPGSTDRFDFRTDDHAHLRCRKCNKVFDAEFEEAYDLLKQLDKIIHDDHKDKLDGFDTDGAALYFYGYCKDCRENNDTDHA